MDNLRCEYDDCVVLTRALRNWTGRRWPEDCTRVKAEIGQLIDVMEGVGPRDTIFQSRLGAARSLIVLGRLSDALDCVDKLLSVVRRIEFGPGRRTQ